MPQFDETIYPLINDMIQDIINKFNTKELSFTQEATIYLGPCSTIEFDGVVYKGPDINIILENLYKLNMNFAIKNISISSSGERSFDCLLQCISDCSDFQNFCMLISLSNGSNKVVSLQNKAERAKKRLDKALQEYTVIELSTNYNSIEEKQQIILEKQNEGRIIEIQVKEAEAKIEEEKIRSIKSFWVRKMVFLKLI